VAAASLKKTKARRDIFAAGPKVRIFCYCAGTGVAAGAGAVAGCCAGAVWAAGAVSAGVGAAVEAVVAAGLAVSGCSASRTALFSARRSAAAFASSMKRFWANAGAVKVPAISVMAAMDRIDFLFNIFGAPFPLGSFYCSNVDTTGAIRQLAFAFFALHG
jgi:hypothetical protein